MSDYELIEYEGEPARKYPNGEIRHHIRGYVLKFPPEHGRALANRKKDLAQEAALEGLTKGTGSKTAEEAWAKIVATKAKGALENDDRAGTEMARFVGKATGFIDDNRQVEVSGQVNHVPVPIDEETRKVLLKLIQERRDNPNVIDGEVKPSGDIYKE